MRNVVIAQTSVVTSVGSDLTSTFQSFLNKKSGIKKIDRFETKNYRSKYAALIKDIETPENRSSFLNLTDLIIDQLNDIPKNCRLLTATTQACVDLFEKNEKKKCSINKYLIPSNIPKYIARKLNLKDSGININSACASPTIAIIKGTQMIKNKRADSVLIFCADIVSEFVFSGFSALNALSACPTQPFDINRKGLNLGDGGAAILLMNEELAKKNHIEFNTSIAGYGIASDATHITAPAKDGRGLIMAVKNALKTAKINADQIGAVNTHGTGTIYNDSMEINALKNIFKDIKIPANSFKGSIGHTLGGAGGIEAAVGTLMLKEHILPGTCGFSNPEKDAENLISSDNVSFFKNYLLSTNSGFAGTNAALVLKRINC
ncbi:MULTISPECIES: beta-ketoacyl-[acyl-carrier-protein] synthase family protein [Desulfobacula]|uniref:FabF2: beta-ketoacyl-acyl-carrier-protein synthase II n=2 Tax=Desulfobacula TaxID=28222 RepID=K0NKD0_DESTT|nr:MULTISPECIES: beta-ketoacyl-[acyl-carrier-protein] synthase family protein [Desulfobacula]CCK82011.1 FabF2: beta-ketoacyl-acyl-carrier-protein synthase II [Desulfobacula toluolica Tol2]SDU43746.1 3-oxoacyl-[acyl-carrier-protein] synthase II [Desulfobacula phenolica]